MGHTVTIAESGEEALATYEACMHDKATAFNLIVTDFQMGGMDGIDLSILIRKHTPDMPIIMITAYGDAKKLQQSGQLNINILDKPTSYEKLAAQITAIQNV